MMKKNFVVGYLCIFVPVYLSPCICALYERDYTKCPRGALAAVVGNGRIASSASSHRVKRRRVRPLGSCKQQERL